MKYGIYKITNCENDECYIGSSASRTRQGAKGRMRDHRTNLIANKHRNQHLQDAWNTYGADVFTFEVVLYCASEDCLMYEQIAIDSYQPTYNICQTAGNSLGFKHSDETIAIFKETRSVRGFRDNVSAKMQGNKHCVGRKLSATTRKKLSEAALKREGVNYSKLNKIQVREIKSLLGENDLTQLQIANQFNVSQSCISMIRSGRTWGGI